jgi:isochorismate hydrolase
MLVIAGPPVPGRPPELDATADLAQIVCAAGGLVIEVLTSEPRPSRTGAVAKAVPGTAAVVTGAAPSASVSSAGWDGFYGSALDTVLRRLGRDHLLMAGWWLETGVHSTLRSANDMGYECLTLVDCCIPLDDLTAAGAVSSIQMSGGIFGATGTSADVLSLLPILESSR